MENLIWVGFLGFLLAIGFAAVQAKKVLSYSEGTERMQKLAAAIREGANAYLRQQYTTVFKVFLVVFAILLVMAFATDGRMLSKFTPFAFVTGGIWSVVGLLGGVSVTGFAVAVFMSNAGGAWANAKKYIESGHHGGKGSDCHKAAVVGDTVGDPFKDTSGPSLNILIKLCSTVSIVFSGLILSFNLMKML